MQRTNLASTAFAITLLFSGLLTTNTADARAPINLRQERQDARIEAGWRQGQLTRCEAARLNARSNRIEHREQHMRATGGLQPRERVHLHASLDSLSRDIAEQRRDGRGCF
jgi:hypothetical protein